jgi:hypothetical protein
MPIHQKLHPQQDPHQQRSGRKEVGQQAGSQMEEKIVASQGIDRLVRITHKE